MDSLRNIVARDTSSSENPLSPAVANLLVTLIILLIIGIVLLGALFLVRRKRQSQKQSELPLYNERSGKTANHRRLTIISTSPNARASSYVDNEKQILMDNSSSPPPSPIPEIRITFPEEEDVAGKRKSGRVVVVRISETGSVGMEPCAEDNLPPYQQTDAERFQSLDLERIGGLKESPTRQQQRWS